MKKIIKKIRLVKRSYWLEKDKQADKVIQEAKKREVSESEIMRTIINYWFKV